MVEAVGPCVKRFSAGDRVFGFTLDGYGGHAEYVCVPEDAAICTMPPGKRFQEVVVGEGAWYANTYLKQFGLGPGHKILIYGASGAIGTAALQLSKIYGAEEGGSAKASYIKGLIKLHSVMFVYSGG